MLTLDERNWHCGLMDRIVEQLETHLDAGLELEEVERRQVQFGLNVLTPKRGRSPIARFVLQFHHPLLYILIVAGAITWGLGEWIDGGVIFAVVVVNAIVGFIQEMKAGNAIEALSRSMTTQATVVREGGKRRVNATNLVPGDIVLLEAGDKVPADIRLAGVRGLDVDESTLTGESLPVSKNVEITLSPDTPLADRANMAYASTLATYGQGLGVVVATGDGTEVGRISQLMAATESVQTPLTRKITSFSRALLYAVIGLAVVTVLVGIARGQPLLDVFIAAIALAVAAIPEGLPAAVTVALAIGVARMARRRAMIRSLATVETLGSATVICADKTGTLTENQMTVQQIMAGGVLYDVSGAGYAPVGQVLFQGDPVEVSSSVALAECLKCGLQCNDSVVIEEEGRWKVHGEPTEGALVVSAHKSGLAPDALREFLTRVDTIPFASEHRYMATLHDAGADRPRIIYVKGAVEAILERCSSELGASGERMPFGASHAGETVEAMANRGLRVLAFASGELPPGESRLTQESIASGLTFLGLQGMMDPPRPDAMKAIQACQNAGIKVKMITGDHAITASAVASQIGLIGGNLGLPQGSLGVLTGKDLAALSDVELADATEVAIVFARVVPEQKLRLVRALQSRGHVVAMTGDGVNDAPALKQADIGVSMGANGTEVAKEASNMVLSDDNFATVEAAVEEGRRIFDNLTKIIAWTLPTNLGEGLIILLAVITGTALPILPVQILWVNMTTVAVLGLILAFESAEPDIMGRPPRNPDSPILTGDLMFRIFLVGTIMLAGAFGLFQWETVAGASVAEARTIAVSVVVMIELLYLFNCRSLAKSVFQMGLVSNGWVFPGVAAMVTLQLAFVYVPVMNRMFQTVPIGMHSWARILGVAATAFLLIEVEKWLRHRFVARKQRLDADQLRDR